MKENTKQKKRKKNHYNFAKIKHNFNNFHHCLSSKLSLWKDKPKLRKSILNTKSSRFLCTNHTILSSPISLQCTTHSVHSNLKKSKHEQYCGYSRTETFLRRETTKHHDPGSLRAMNVYMAEQTNQQLGLGQSDDEHTHLLDAYLKSAPEKACCHYVKIYRNVYNGRSKIDAEYLVRSAPIKY